jgi:hypothetical protein
MGWKYLGGKTWAEVTRDERFFCQHLYSLIREDVPGFVRKLNELAALNLPDEEEWEVGFEVCFYRDHRFMCAEDKHVWHGNTDMYSSKRTFDLCLFSHDHIVIIEAKAAQGFELKQIGEFMNDLAWVKEAVAVVKGDGAAAGHIVDVYVVALASKKYLDKLDWGKINRESTFSGEAISWAALAEHYGMNEKKCDPVLLRADAIYRGGQPGGKNNAKYKYGLELVAEGQQGEVTFVGRRGGLKGKSLKDDVDSGGWETQLYETSMAETKPNQNWFSLPEFVAAVSPANNGDSG